MIGRYHSADVANRSHRTRWIIVIPSRFNDGIKIYMHHGMTPPSPAAYADRALNHLWHQTLLDAQVMDGYNLSDTLKN